MAFSFLVFYLPEKSVTLFVVKLFSSASFTVGQQIYAVSPIQTS